MALDINMKSQNGEVSIGFSRTTTLTHNQILLLQTNPVEVVPAPGVGKVNLLINSLVVTDFSMGNYSNEVGSYFEIAYEAGDPTSISIGIGHLNGTTRISSLQHSAEDESYDLVNTENKSLNLIINGSANLQDGHASNTLTITVFYVVADV